MKLRIKGNSIRYRLTRPDVNTLANTSYLEEQINFAGSTFIYALQVDVNSNALSATLGNNKITMLVPRSFVKDWPQNEVVGFDANMQVNANESVYLLLEKDFVCLDETTEDQSDNFENPNKTC